MPEEIRPKTSLSAVKYWAERALDLVYPRLCQFCSRPLSETEKGVVCPGCLGGAKKIVAPFCQRCAWPFDGRIDGEFVCSHCHDLKFYFSRAVAACQATGVVRDCIHRFKYNREMYYERHLTDWLVEGAREQIDWSGVNLMVPVPLHPRKKREREFNQAEVLAKSLQQAFQVPMDRKNLRRIKDTATQTKLNAEERSSNLRDAFALRGAEGLKGKRVVLVDDVFTTGATLNACAKVLSEAGCGEIIALAVARGV